MRKIYIMFLFFSLSVQNIYSQVTNFDTSYVIASSLNFDYKNPVFNYLHGFSFLERKDWMTYEKHNEASSNIILRSYTYDSYQNEIQVTNDPAALNINPSIAGNIYTGYVLMWQSNINGDWDIYYTRFDSAGNFTSPQPISLTPGNEQNPYITLLGNNKFTLAFERDGDIILGRFNPLTGDLFLDTNITTNILNDCKKPIIASDYELGYVTYEIDSLGTNKLCSQRFTVGTDTAIFLQTQYFNTQENNQSNLSSAYSNGDFIIYDYDTLGSKEIIYADPDFSAYFTATDTIPGNCTQGRSIYYPIITDNGFFPNMTALAFVLRENDSTVIKTAKIGGKTLFKNYYLGDSSVQTNLNFSRYVTTQKNYKIRLVWEQNLNGKTALVESYMTDVLYSVSQISNTIPNNYSLSQNYPNPFNPTTSIRFEIPRHGFVSLRVFDISGREVAELVKEEMQPGVYEYNFDGSGLGSGVYFYILSINNFSETKRMVLVK